MSARDEAAAPFFQPGHTYAREHHGRTIEFHVIHVAIAPDCEFPTAFGWRKDPEIDVMLPMDADDFHGCGWTDITGGAPTPDFFVPGRTYTRTLRTGIHLRFECVSLTSDPKVGDREAWGWVLRSNGTRCRDFLFDHDYPLWTPEAGDR